jgi:uncharacterized protein YkwD
VDRRTIVGVLVIVAAVTANHWIPWVTPDPRPEVVARGSAQVGWTEAPASRDIALDVHERVNEERLARGLAPLAWHEGLTSIAESWSEEMIEHVYEHSTAEFRAHPDFAGSAENIAMGYRDSGELHLGWMRSDGHRENILDPSVTALGVGIVCRNDGQMWATQVFGVPHGTPPSPSRPPTSADPIVRAETGVSCPTHDRWLGP